MSIVNYFTTITIVAIIYLVIPVYGLTTKNYWLCSTWFMPILYLAAIAMMGNRHVKIAWQKTIQTIRSIVY